MFSTFSILIDQASSWIVTGLTTPKGVGTKAHRVHYIEITDKKMLMIRHLFILICRLTSCTVGVLLLDVLVDLGLVVLLSTLLAIIKS